jgi:transposase-like protein
MNKNHPTRKLTVREFFKQFPNEDVCLEYVMKVRFGLRHTCAACGVVDATFHRIANRKKFECAHCGAHIAPCAGTIFHKSSTSLQVWFYAIYLFSVSRNGLSGMELHRTLGVTRKTGQRMARQIRILMEKADAAGAKLLKGVVESDEAFVGGALKGVGPGNYRSNKVIILGLKERGGRLVARVIPDTKSETIRKEFHKNISPNASIHTDEASHYNLVKGDKWDHKFVNRSKEQYVRPDHLTGGPDIHVNGMENFWRNFKSSIRGTHVHISKRHAQKYVDEFTFRANSRHLGNAMFDALIAAV